LNIVLISRTLKKLEDLAIEIRTDYNVETKIIQIDFTKGLSVYDIISENIENLDIGVLVNNVGLGPDKKSFLLTEKSYVWDVIACNIISIPFMTKLVLPKMLQKKSGLIINISSLSSMI